MLGIQLVYVVWAQVNHAGNIIAIYGFALIIAVPGQPGNVQRLCTVVVWQAPSQPNGIITRYDINFQPGTTRMLSAQTSFYLTTTEERHPDTTVKVPVVYFVLHM